MKIIFNAIILLLLTILAACTTTATPAPELETVTVQFNWQHSSQFTGFYVADARGFYAEEGLDVTLTPLIDVSTFPDVFQQVVDGEVDFSLTNNNFLADTQVDGVPLTVISNLLQSSPTVLFARADSGIVTPADLAGHTIAVKNSGWQLLIEQLLNSVNLTIDDVVAVEAGFDMTPFYEGEVDVWAGFVTNEVVRARQEGLELVTFPISEYVDLQSTISIFTSQDLLGNQPELAVKFLRATLRGWEWAIENPTAATDIMLERFPDLAEEQEFQLASFSAYIPLLLPLGGQVGAIDCEQWLSDERYTALESTEGLCIEDIFEQATGSD